MTAEKPARRLYRTGIGIGSVTLLVVFTLLSLAILALLSLSTSLSAQRLSRRSALATTNMALAESTAATHLQTIDATLYDAQQQLYPGQPDSWQKPLAEEDHAGYYQLVHSRLRGLGYAVTPEENLLSFTVPIDKNNQLQCTLRILPPGGAQRYTIEEFTAAMTGDWQPEEGGQLWDGT